MLYIDLLSIRGFARGTKEPKENAKSAPANGGTGKSAERKQAVLQPINFTSVIIPVVRLTAEPAFAHLSRRPIIWECVQSRRVSKQLGRLAKGRKGFTKGLEVRSGHQWYYPLGKLDTPARPATCPGGSGSGPRR